MKKKQMECPICRGKGSIEIPASKNPNIRIILNVEYIAKQLRKEDYSYREIARLMGYNNPQSIKNIVDK